MECTVQAIFRAHFDEYAETHRLPPHQRQAAWSIIHCRTAALGGHIQACPEGHVERVWYNSCKHRSCPQCNQIQIERWLEFQQARLLACSHHHLIFTLPHQLNPLWSFNRGVMTEL
ncbi:MAG: transposase zinc-binding domain-containing protein, partial [Acidobacteria bacterium]|nr:transposase zinc-binding domain-containing protein [Acidobacteriota bacterium]